MKIPRILLTAPASGSGKTLITCGILNLLKRKGLKVASFKCGPDYIDPMFHTTVIGTKSRNLDTFFTDGDTACYLMENMEQTVRLLSWKELWDSMTELPEAVPGQVLMM